MKYIFKKSLSVTFHLYIEYIRSFQEKNAYEEEYITTIRDFIGFLELKPLPT